MNCLHPHTHTETGKKTQDDFHTSNTLRKVRMCAGEPRLCIKTKHCKVTIANRLRKSRLDTNVSLPGFANDDIFQ